MDAANQLLRTRSLAEKHSWRLDSDSDDTSRIVFTYLVRVVVTRGCCCLQVRTQTLVKNAIVVVDATPFKQFYLQHYGVELGTKKKIAAGLLDAEKAEKEEEKSHSKHVNRKHQQRAKGHKIDTLVRSLP